MRSPAELTDHFRARGMKATPQRLAVFEALHGDDGHPTAELIWNRVRSQMPTVSLRTVYQVLNDLVDLGEVQSVDLGAGPARFDPNTDPHDHFVCRICGVVVDVPAERPMALPAAITASYRIESAEIVFRGRCGGCVASSEASEV